MTGLAWTQPIARVRRGTQIVGTGLLVPGNVVLTCAHVVTTALQGSNTVAAPGAEIILDFPFAGLTDVKATVSEAGWHPKIDEIQHGVENRPSDLAALVIRDPRAVVEIAPCLLAETNPAAGTSFSAQGFPAGYPSGTLSQGTLQGVDASGRLDAIADSALGHFVDYGFSGAPIFAGQGSGVVAGTALGLCVTSDAGGKRIARIIPASHLVRVLRDVVSPYRWLSAFETTDACFFFGREVLADGLWHELRERGFLLLAGAPGSGKSSVLRAGLASRAVAADHAVRIIRPLGDARAEIAAALGLARDAGEPELAEAIRKLTEQHSLLIGIDQAEELVRGGEVDRTASLLQFLAQLHAALKDRLLLALAARVDALGALFAVQPRPSGPYGPGLLEQHLRTLDPMGREELLNAIERPAARLGVKFAPGLAAQIVDDALRHQVPLPCVQLCLSRLWQSRGTAPLIPTSAYLEIKGVTGALASHASSVLNCILADVQAMFPDIAGIGDAMAGYCRLLLLQLVDVGASETADRRQRIAVPDLPRFDDPRLGETQSDEATTLARRAFEESRLVVAVRLPDGREALELAHDSLLTEWAELHAWTEQDRTLQIWRASIRPGLSAWLANRRDEGPLLRGGMLAQAQDWLASRWSDLGNGEIAFIEASTAFAEREAAERQAARVAELSLVRQSEISHSLRLAVAARGLMAQSPETALLIAGEAIRLDHNAITDEILREAVEASGTEVRRLGTDIVHAAFSPDGGIVVLSAGGEVRRFDADGFSGGGFRIEGVRVVGGALSPDGSMIVAVGADGQGHLAQMSGSRLGELPAWSVPESYRRLSLMWNRTGDMILVTDENAAWVWEVTARTVRAPWDHRKPWESALSRWAELDRQGGDASETAWNDLERLRETGHAERIFDAALSPDEQQIATGSEDSTVKLWDRQGRHLATLTDDEMGPVIAVGFVPGGLVSGHMDRSARLWSADGVLIARLEGHGADVRHILASPASDGFVTAVEGGGVRDGRIRFWNCDGSLRLALEGHTDYIAALAFNEDGRFLASGSSDQSVRVWTKDGECLATLKGHAASVVEVAFGASSTRLISRDRDGEARLWRLQPGSYGLVTRSDAIVAAATYWGDDKLVVSSVYDGTTRVTRLSDGASCLEMPGMSALRPGARETRITGDRLWTVETQQYFGVFGLGPTATIHTAIRDPQGVVTRGPSYAVPVTGDNDDEFRSFYPAPGGDALLIRRTRSAALISIADCRQVQLHGPNYNKSEALTVDYAMFAPHGRHVVTGSINGSLWIWSNQGDLLGGRLIDGSGARDNLYSIAVSPEGDTLLTTIRAQADLWDLSLSHLNTLPCETNKVKCGLFSPDGSRILTVAEAALPDMRLWDREGRLITVLPIDDRTDPATVVFAPEAPLLVWPCLQTLYVYDLDGHQVARLATSLDEAIRLFAFDPAGTRVAIGSYGSDIQLWSLEGNGLLLTTLKAHAKEINSLQFSRDGTRLLTSSSDGAVREFLIDSETLIAYAACRAPRSLTEEEIERYAIPLPLRFRSASAL